LIQINEGPRHCVEVRSAGVAGCDPRGAGK